MSEPKRLIEDGTEFDRTLLRAHRTELASPGYEQRVIAAALGATSPIDSDVAKDEKPSFVARFARPRYMAAIALGIGAAALAATAAQRTAPPVPIASASAPPPVSAELAATAEPQEVVTTPDALPNVLVPSAATVATRASAAPAPSAHGSDPPPTTSGGSGASLQREVELLDGVKRALRTGAHADAGRALDAYDAEFPQGSLKPEAGFLRVRLLLAKGDRAGATALGEDLLRRYPDTVHAKRIRAALAAPP